MEIKTNAPSKVYGRGFHWHEVCEKARRLIPNLTPADAKKYFEKSLNLNKNNKKTYEDYGNILLKLNKHYKALDYIRKGTGFIRFTQKDFKII